MTKLKLNIMIRACKIRMNAGESLEDILNSYPSLSQEDRQQIIDNLYWGANMIVIILLIIITLLIILPCIKVSANYDVVLYKDNKRYEYTNKNNQWI